MSRLFPTLLVSVLLLGFAWQLAHWTWVFAAPSALATRPSSDSAIDMAAIARLFGAEAPGATVAASTSGLRLKGVVAPTPGVAASAIFGVGGARDISVYVGRDVQSGVTLAEVHADHVIVSRAGVPERIDLDVRRAATATPGPGAAARAGTFRINVARTAANTFSFSRRELDDALRDPGQLNYLGQIGQPTSGGVRLEQAPAGSLAQKLGLQPGDVIKKVNGQSVASTGDLARLYAQYSVLSSIQAEVQRGTATVQLGYSIQP